MTEHDILAQYGAYWVSRDKHGVHVWRDGVTAATRVQSFAATDDGESLANAYAKYLGGRTLTNKR